MCKPKAYDSGFNPNNLAQLNPYEWYGMAAFASKAAGDGMAMAEYLKLSPTTLDGPDPSLVEEALGDGNLAIFMDMYPQYLAYKSNDMAEIETMFQETEPPPSFPQL